MKPAPERSGFTLVELLVVIVILGILLAMMVPAAGMILKKVKVAQARSDAQIVVATMSKYRLEYNRWPEGEEVEGSEGHPATTKKWVDIMNPGMNKGFAVKKLQKLLDVPPENCAAFGDYLNDLEMLRAVKYSYAMENAHPTLFEAATYRAPSNTTYGVTKKLRELLDEGRI